MGRHLVEEHLDCCLCNFHWQSLGFFNVVTHLIAWDSDHVLFWYLLKIQWGKIIVFHVELVSNMRFPGRLMIDAGRLFLVIGKIIVLRGRIRLTFSSRRLIQLL